jgi:folate-binding protein YgfZ
MIKLTHWSVIKITGKEVAHFLQGQLTCDVIKIPDQQCSLAALCNHQGRVLAVLFLYKAGEDFYALLPSCVSEQFVKHLTKFAVFSKVTLEDISATTCVFGLIGNQEETSAHNLIKLPVEADLYLTFEPLEKTHSMTTDESVWKVACISSGLPFIYHQTIAAATPHMLSLQLIDKAVSFNKGCYVGQEIIARTHYLGKSKRQLYSAVIEGNTLVQPGDVLKANNQDVGLIIDSVIFDEANLVLAVIQDSAVDQDIFCGERCLAKVAPARRECVV